MFYYLKFLQIKAQGTIAVDFYCLLLKSCLLHHLHVLSNPLVFQEYSRYITHLSMCRLTWKVQYGKTKPFGHTIAIKIYFRGLRASAFQKPFLWYIITFYKSSVITDNILLGNFHFKELVLIFQLPLILPLFPSQKKVKRHLFWNKR